LDVSALRAPGNRPVFGAQRARYRTGMQTLLLMRHAKSSWDDAAISDYDRPLNARGRRAAPRMGQLLREEGLVPDLIVTSSARRALETAQAVATAAGYGLAKYRFRGRGAVFATILGAIAVPGTALAVPTFLLFSQVGLTNTMWAIILPSLVSPFGLYLMWVFSAEAVPTEILEAARVDGSGEWRTFFTISLRLLAPGIVTVALFVAIVGLEHGADLLGEALAQRRGIAGVGQLLVALHGPQRGLGPHHRGHRGEALEHGALHVGAILRLAAETGDERRQVDDMPLVIRLKFPQSRADRLDVDAIDGRFVGPDRVVVQLDQVVELVDHPGLVHPHTSSRTAAAGAKVGMPARPSKRAGGRVRPG